MSALFLVLIGTAYTLVMVGAFRAVGAWLDWRDARTLAEFKAQCLLAEAERIGHRRAQEREWGSAA